MKPGVVGGGRKFTFSNSFYNSVKNKRPFVLASLLDKFGF